MEHRFSLATLGLILALEVGAAEQIPPLLPVEDFARADIASAMSLSRDGRTISYSSGLDRDWMTILRDWDTGKTRDIGNGAGPFRPVWTAAERFLTGGGRNMNREGADLAERTSGSAFVPVVVAPHLLLSGRIDGAHAGDVLVLRYDVPIAGRRQLQYVPCYPHVDRMNLPQGVPVEQVRNPGGVVTWLADQAGLVRVGSDTKGTMNRVIWRDREGGEWRVPPGLDYARDEFFPRWLSADGATLFLARRTESGRWGLFSYDLAQGRMGEMILGHDYFDVGAESGPVLAPGTRELLGFYFNADKPRAAWFDPRMADVQKAFDQALPGRINRIVDLSDDLKRMIMVSWTAKDPGMTYQFDFEAKALKPLFPNRPWIKPAQMAEVFPASFKARDGEVVHGYLTVPAGRQAKDLPVVIMVHDGPGRREGWGFNAEAQFLANRGYAVLAINQRGSKGYGRDYEEKATRHYSSVPADDIADAAGWAVVQGIAGSGRIALLGRGLGGTAALLSLTRDPALYRCAITIDPVTDWPVQLAHVAQINPAAIAFLRDRIGDPERDVEELRAASPIHHVAKLDRPVFLIYGPAQMVSRDDSKAYRAALSRLKKPYELLAKQDDVDGFAFTPGRVELLTRLEKFLAQNLGAALK